METSMSESEWLSSLDFHYKVQSHSYTATDAQQSSPEFQTRWLSWWGYTGTEIMIAKSFWFRGRDTEFCSPLKISAALICKISGIFIQALVLRFCTAPQILYSWLEVLEKPDGHHFLLKILSDLVAAVGWTASLAREGTRSVLHWDAQGKCWRSEAEKCALLVPAISNCTAIHKNSNWKEKVQLSQGSEGHEPQAVDQT